jgi:hypothetical protein
MNIQGIDYLTDLVKRSHWEAKCLLGEAGLAIFPSEIQHAQAGFPELTYRDDYTGTALAGMVKPTLIELRLHKHFSSERVLALWTRVQAQSPVTALYFRQFRLFYGGKQLTLNRPPVSFP